MCFALHVHLVFVTKYRRKVFNSEHLTVLAEVFADVCADFGAVLRNATARTTRTRTTTSRSPTRSPAMRRAPGSWG